MQTTHGISGSPSSLAGGSALLAASSTACQAAFLAGQGPTTGRNGHRGVTALKIGGWAANTLLAANTSLASPAEAATGLLLLRLDVCSPHGCAV